MMIQDSIDDGMLADDVMPSAYRDLRGDDGGITCCSREWWNILLDTMLPTVYELNGACVVSAWQWGSDYSDQDCYLRPTETVNMVRSTPVTLVRSEGVFGTVPSTMIS